MVVFIHIANVLYVGSYLVKDILWLRALTILGGGVLLAYYALMPTPLWAAMAWNVLFLTINAAQIRALLLERRPVRFEPREMRLYQLAFRSLTPREFAKLCALARWEDVATGACIVRRGEALDRLMVVASGKARVEVDGSPVVELRAGRFVGEMSFLTGERPSADVVAADPACIVSWPQGELRALLGKHTDLRAAVQAVIGEDLVAKLRPA
jgi:CRP-like cAMP-binding protein